MVTTSTYGQRIREARRAAGLTQAVLAERAGIHQAVLSHYENDKRSPQAEGLRKIAAGLGIDPGQLVP